MYALEALEAFHKARIMKAFHEFWSWAYKPNLAYNIISTDRQHIHVRSHERDQTNNHTNNFFTIQPVRLNLGMFQSFGMTHLVVFLCFGADYIPDLEIFAFEPAGYFAGPSDARCYRAICGLLLEAHTPRR